MARGHRGLNYHAEEDELLCRAWAEVSANPRARAAKGRKEAFMELVKPVYERKLRQRGRTVVERSALSLFTRFRTITVAVKKFSAYYADALAEDVGRDAEEAEKYALDHCEADASQFRFLQCWRVLRKSAQWRNQIKATARRGEERARGRDSKRQRVSAPDDETSTASDHLAGDLYDDDEPTEEQDEANEGEGEEAERQDGAEQPIAAHPVVAQTTQSRQSKKRDQVERALLTLCAQRTQTVEQSVADTEARLRIAQEEVDLRLFSTPVPSFEEDPMAHEYLTLRRQQVMQRLKAEIAASGNNERE